MTWIGGFEPRIRAAVPDQDRFPVRKRPAGDPLTHLEARHLADRDRTIAGGLHLQLLLDLVDQGECAALETNQL